MLVLRDLAKSVSLGRIDKVLLVDVSLELMPGELIAIMGESGVGKSTLLNLVAGLDRPTRGCIAIDDEEVTALDDRKVALLRRRQIGFVFQAFHILPYLNVAENVALPLRLNAWSNRDADLRVAEMLAAVGLADRANARPRELSGGELQRVAIARALAHRPKVLLADEPTGNLDAETADQVLTLLRSEQQRNRAAALLVTHSERAARIADRVLVLREGSLHAVAATAPK